MTLDSPYNDISQPASRWLRGNLHAHTTLSDGQLSPQVAIDSYAALGHDFLAISDHDQFAGAERWSEWDARGMTPIFANEITKNGVHLLHLGGDRRIDPDPDRQAVINEIGATRGLAVVNHPNWFARFNHCPQLLLETWSGYVGLEIYNGVIEWLDGSPYALNNWDMLLSLGRRAWGFAHDDSHFARDIGRGWNVVAADSREPGDILVALAAGKFYASTGVEIETIAIDGTTVTIVAPDASRIVAVTKNGKRVAIHDGDTLSFDLSHEKARDYIRFECYGTAERAAWTQPFWLRP